MEDIQKKERNVQTGGGKNYEDELVMKEKEKKGNKE